MAHRFGDLEAVVMERVWSSEQHLTVREVHQSLLLDRQIAYTTVMSTMDNLYRKGWLDRQRHGKAYLYWPTLSRAQYSARLMRQALDGTQPDLVLAHFVEQISDDESDTLSALLCKIRREPHRD